MYGAALSRSRCAGGQDRTSMAVTVEQAQLLLEYHGVGSVEASGLADEMRAYGVRWQNMRKNATQQPSRCGLNPTI